MSTLTASLVDEYTARNFDREEYFALRGEIFSSESRFRAFEDIVAGLDESSMPERVKRGIGLTLMNRFPEAIAILQSVSSDKVAQSFYAFCLLEVNRPEDALELFSELAKSDRNNVPLLVGKVRATIAMGSMTQARKLIESFQAKHPEEADFQYLMGMLHEGEGEYAEAQECYDRALGLDSNHSGAQFRVAFRKELMGDPEAAVAGYEAILDQEAWHVGTLLNLGALYEDTGRYDDAIECYERILRAVPDHERALLFRKDAVGSLGMFFDEDQERRADKRNQILRIPITDFELSVRSKNCLAKMNVRTLGDLCRKSEQELLNYKNFGETSLFEIREILNKKGLRLGMFHEDEMEVVAAAPVDGDQEQTLGLPITEIEFSIRSRKALNSLDIRTVGDLVSRSEADFFTVKNFGSTSMNEIKQKLAEHGLKLKDGS